jgi:hypothetical protein
MTTSSKIKERERLKERYNDVTVRMFGYVTLYSKDSGKFRANIEPNKKFDKEYGNLGNLELNRERVRLCSEMNELATLDVLAEENKMWENE